MKFIQFTVLSLFVASTNQAVLRKTDEIWGEVMDSGLDASTYLKDSPKAYTEADKPKPNPQIAIN